MTGWLTSACGHKVEHIPCPRPGQRVTLTAPPKGVLHTTEGSTVEGALAVFRQHYAPHFTVGVDRKGRGRILQHVPLGEMAAALENHPGGVETNRVVRAQIEVVGFSKKTQWLPLQPTLGLLAKLLAELQAAGIQLRHPYVKRDPQRWTVSNGWVGHVDVPENVHWDPGQLNYQRLFRLARLADPDLRVRKRPRVSLPVGRTAALRRAAKKGPR